MGKAIKKRKHSKHEGKKQFRLRHKWLGVLLAFILSVGLAGGYVIAKLGGGERAKVQNRTTQIQGPPSQGGIVSGTRATHEATVNLSRLYEKVNCECGNCDDTLAKCNCKPAQLMKDRIASLKREHKTEEEILDWMVDRYGPKVLASKSEPPKRQPPPRVSRRANRAESPAELSAQKRLSHSKEKSPPKIKVIPETYDFGKIPPEKVNHTFSVESIGGSTLEIFKVSTSCGCTTASIDRRMIEPGESAKMVVNFDPTLHDSSKKGETGQMKREIYIRSNDPEAPEKTIAITATVVEGG